MPSAQAYQQQYGRIIAEALQAFSERTGCAGLLTALEPDLGKKYRPDAQVDLVVADQIRHYVVECKSYVDRKIQAEQVLRQFESLNMQGILITPYVSRDIADYCRSIDLQFMDTHGNVYLRGPGLFIYITGERTEQGLQPARTNKGITNSAGLRIAFALLCKPNLISASYKEIARLAKVSVGTANNAFGDLERRGYLINKGDAQRRKLLEPARLLDEWASNYPITLRSKLYSRRFSAPDPDWWKTLSLDDDDAAWGGEVAALELIHHLKPATQTLYVAAPVLDVFVKRLLVHYRLRPDPKGPIEIVEKFWDTELERQRGYAPDVLVYSELLALLDPRAKETAGMIKEKYIDPAFDQA